MLKMILNLLNVFFEEESRVSKEFKEVSAGG